MNHEARLIRTCLFTAGVLALCLLAMWPRGTVAAALRAGSAPDTFTAAAVCFLLLLLYFGARFGAEGSRESAAPVREVITLTPVSLTLLAARRMRAAALETVLMLAAGAPFLAATMAVGGAGGPQALCALAVIGTASFAAGACGFLLLVLVGRRSIRDLLLMPFLAASLVVTFFAAPGMNPVHAVVFLLKSPEGPRDALVCAAENLGIALVLAGAARAAMSAVRGRARKRGGPGA
ncbi:MAG: hypothetical protein ACLQDL_06160 [Spirochaetia bacterium]